MPDTRLGFIGVGTMGGPMARRLLAAGYPLTVHDRDPAAAAALAREGAVEADSPAVVARRSEVVLVCLPTPDVVKAVALGPGGLLDGAPAAVLSTYIDLSTTGPIVAAEVAERLQGANIDALDAPITGGAQGAIEGTLTVIGAGPGAAFAQARPVLEVLGQVHHVGERAGTGQLLKLINNLLSSVALTASAEALALGVKAGLDLGKMLDVINAGSGRNSATLEKFPRSILPRRFTGGLALGLAYKDVRLCLEQAEAYGVPMRLGSAARESMFLAKTVLGPEVDATRLVQLVEQWAGVTLGAPEPDSALDPAQRTV